MSTSAPAAVQSAEEIWYVRPCPLSVLFLLCFLDLFSSHLRSNLVESSFVWCIAEFICGNYVCCCVILICAPYSRSNRGEEDQQSLDKNIEQLTTEQLKMRTRMLTDNAMIMRTEANRLIYEIKALKDQVKEGQEKVKLHKQLPYLVSNVIEVLELPPETEEDGAVADANALRNDKCVVIKTSARQTVFLPVVGLVDAETLKPGTCRQRSTMQTGRAILGLDWWVRCCV